MSMVSLRIEVNNPDLEVAERDEQATDLGRRLRELDDAALSTIAGAATTPHGSKAEDGPLIGAFALTLAATRNALGAALETIRGWVAAASARSVVVEIDGDQLEINGADREQINRAMDVFLNKHAQEDS